MLLDAPDQKVKRILVHPGQRLSLQRLKRRSKDRYVVAGIGTLDGREMEMETLESVELPSGACHMLANSGDSPLVLVAISVGMTSGKMR